MISKILGPWSQEEDHSMEVAISVRTLQGHGIYPQGLSQYLSESISQEDLKKIKHETEMHTGIEESKETINFCINEEESSDRDMAIFDIAIYL